MARSRSHPVGIVCLATLTLAALGAAVAASDHTPPDPLGLGEPSHRASSCSITPTFDLQRDLARFGGSLLLSSQAVAASAGLSSGSGPSQPSAASGPEQAPPFVPGEVLVKIKPGVPSSRRAALRAQVSAETLHSFRSGAEHWALPGGVSVRDALAFLAAHPDVDYAEPNYVVAIDLTPNDPRYPDLWGLRNSGQTGGTAGADIDAESAWDIVTGSPGVVVGVIDTGVSYDHSDLAANMWTNPGEIPDNGQDDDGNGFIDDVYGWDFINNDNDPFDDHSHGTHVAGTIAAVGNNQIGVVGVAWQARIMALKFLGASGSGSTSDAVRAVEYATMMGADMTNNSWGGGGFSQALLDAINAGGDAGVLFVAAAGNSGRNTDASPHYPSSYDSPAVVSVAATDHNDNLAGFSNYGLVSVDLGAPGVNTLSSIPGDGYGFKSGTSMATPHVAGVAALLRSLRPAMGLPFLKARLINEGDPIPALAGRTVSGKRLNAFLSVREPDGVPPGGITDLAVETVDITTADLVWTATGDDDATGTASSHHVRYSTVPLDETNFDAATLVSNVPAPQIAGSTERVTVGGLNASTTYYFAVKAVDEWGNRGPISNVATATTLPGVADISLQDAEVGVESTLGYFTTGALTVHNLPITEPPEGSGRIEVFADGDFGASSEYASVTAEGITLGSVGRVGADCIRARGEFPLSSSQLSDLAADGTVRVDVQNSISVHTHCSLNQHVVRLSYKTEATSHDYGQVFVGGNASWTITIESRGTDVLELHSITSDAPEFAPSDDSMTINPGDSRELVVTFTPSSVATFQGVLRLQSNDPDEGDLLLDLSGEGLAPPDIQVVPTRFDEAVLSGQTLTRTLTISNTGQNDLLFEIANGGPSGNGSSGVQQGLGGGGATSDNPPLGAGYADGFSPARERILSDPATQSVDSGQTTNILLVQSGTDVSEIEDLLEDFVDITAVDVFNASGSVPTLDFLRTYGVVIVIVNTRPSNQDDLGDVLADYVDQGGRLVLTLASFASGFEVRGRLLGDGYMPFDIGSGPVGSSTLGGFLPGHPMLDGVQSATGHLLAAVTVAADADWVADWEFGQPMIATNDRGVVAINVFVGGTGNWEGDIPLLLHNAAFFRDDPAPWLVSDPRAGTVVPGASTDVAITFDATDLFGGTYQATLIIKSNDPDEPEVQVPVVLDVTGTPRLEILGQEFRLSSTISYTTSGATTAHALPLTEPVGAGSTGSIDVTVDGDFGSSSEVATVTAEGLSLGTLGGVGSDCMPDSDSFSLSEADVANLTADNIVNVQVQNSFSVNVFCSNNDHNVVFRYRGSATALDFSDLFIGLDRTLSLQIVNDGTDVLDVHTISTDEPDFTTSPSSMQLAPKTSRQLDVIFAPSRDGPITGVLTIQSNDPLDPLHTVDLSGVGVVPPDIGVTPASISEALVSGEQAVHVLTIDNTGGSDLEVALDLAEQFPDDAPPPNAPRSSGEQSTEPLDPSETAGAAVPLADPETLAPAAATFSFRDGFEDGDFAGWSITSGSGIREVTDATAAAGTLFSYHESQSPAGHFDGIYQVFGQVQPKYIRFFVRAGSSTLADGYFVIRGPGGSDAIWFHMHDNGRLYVNADVGGDNSVVYAANVWYEIEFRNVDFTTKTFDYYVDGQLILAGIPFRNRNSIQSFHRLDLYNFHAPGEAWWDEIFLAADLRPSWITVDPAQATVPPGGTLQANVTIDSNDLFGGQYHADVVATSNDPDEPQVSVPVDLDVTGVPDIEILGQPIALESAVAFTTSGAVTSHAFPIDVTPSGGGTIDVVADGDFGSSSEVATISAEGIPLGQVGAVGSDCTPAQGSFPLTATDLATLTADGVVGVQAANTFSVNVICAVNEHRVTLSYRGPADPLDFGDLFVNLTRTLVISVENDGTDVLEVSSITSDVPEFTPSVSSMTLAPKTRKNLAITFAPVDPLTFSGVLTLISNDPDENVRTISLLGQGLIPPDISVLPTSLAPDLVSGDIAVFPLTIDNSGGSDLFWSIEIGSGDGAQVVSSSPTLGTTPATPPVKQDATVPPSDPDPADVYSEPIAPGRAPTPSNGVEATLERLLEELNERSRDITDAIPNRFQFSGGETGSSIIDGGSDMYDGGNFLSTNRGGPLLYSNKVIADAPSLLGPGGRYFTAKYPGLFVFVADVQGLQHFTISGNLGADGSGSVEGSVLEVRKGGATFLGFVKRVFGAGDPSVNHLIIVQATPDVTHEFSTNTNDDYHRLSGTVDVPRIHYLLYAGTGGSRIGDDDALEIMKAYLGALPVDWASAAPPARARPGGEKGQVYITVDSTDLLDGDYHADVIISSNDPDEPEVVVPIDMHVTGIPDIRVAGALVAVESTRNFQGRGASTSHALALPETPLQGGELRVVVDGDFGNSNEFADVSAEGLPLGQVGRSGSDCSPAEDGFAISQADLANLASDGLVGVRVVNSFGVESFCATNRHSVVLSYRVSADPLDFGSFFIGLSRTKELLVENPGTATLEISAIAVDDPQYTVSVNTLSIPPRTSESLQVTFRPTLAQVSPAVLTITSNDPDQPDTTVTITGEGQIPPDVDVTPPALSSNLFTGQTDAQTLDVGNTGGSDLIWSSTIDLTTASQILANSGPLNTAPQTPAPKETITAVPAVPEPADVYAFGANGGTPTTSATITPGSLEDVLLRLDAGFDSITNRIPSRFDFSGGEVGSSIRDGGRDMYDGGNFLTTNLGGPLQYTNGPIRSDPALGSSGRYFTRKYPGLFVMVAEVDGIDHFTISGNLGADGAGFADGSTLQTQIRGVNYLGFVKRVWGAFDPSVNHLVILESHPNVTHEFSTNTNDDYHRVFNLSGVRRIHYLLYARTFGGYIDDTATLAILNAYLNELPDSWLVVDPRQGVVPAASSQGVEVRFGAVGLDGGDYTALLTILSNDPDEASVDVPVNMHVTAAPDIEVSGQLHRLESTREYLVTAAETRHAFEDLPPSAGDGAVELVVEGDFDGLAEVAEISVDGIELGRVGRSGVSCSSVSGTFPVPAAQMATLLADSRIDAQVRNTSDVDANCPANRHTVRLAYFGPPGQLDHGSLFIGLTNKIAFEVSNNGVLDLNISSITSDQADFTPSPSSLTIAPGGSQVVEITFAPSVPGLIQGALTIASDDPDEGQVTVQVSGTGVIPPDIDVTPVSIAETVLIGREVVRPLHIANTNVGGADLVFEMSAVPVLGQNLPVAPMPPPEEAAAGPGGESGADRPTTDAAPEDYTASETEEQTSQGAKVLIVQDVFPWNYAANQLVLTANGIAFDQIRVRLLERTDLHEYDVVLVPSDQTLSFYQRISHRKSQLEAYVAAGGTLEFHAAGWGYNNGNASLVTLPGDVTIQRYSEVINFVTAPTHPIADNVPVQIVASFASHSILNNLPADATVVATDALGRPTLAVYQHGLGRVVVGCQTFEFGYARGLVTGQLLANMIPWAFRTAEPTVPWLSPTEAFGSVVAESSFPIEMTLDATGLDPAVYEAAITVLSNDPDEPEVTVPVSLDAVRLIAEAGPPQQRECDGNNHAITTLDGTGSEHMDGPGGITWYGWYEAEDPIGQGALLTIPLPLGQNTVRLEIMDAIGATSTDETTVTVEDTTPPTGSITAPQPDACHGPASLPLTVLDGFTDICDPQLDRTYDCQSPTAPDGACPDTSSGPSYTAHGDYQVGVTAVDEGGNSVGDSETFTIDTTDPPHLLITEPPAGSQFVLPDSMPFDITFEAHDDDGALGEIVHEVIQLAGCVAFDGQNFGTNIDGLLRDETVTLDEAEMCRISDECGFTSLVTPELRVNVADCGDNVTSDTRTLSSIALKPGLCSSIPLDVSGAGATTVSWAVQPNAMHYDVIRGDLANITADESNVHLGNVTCVERDSLDTTTVGDEDTQVPAPGQVFFYVVQSDDGDVLSGYGRASDGRFREALPENGACW